MEQILLEHERVKLDELRTTQDSGQDFREWRSLGNMARHPGYLTFMARMHATWQLQAISYYDRAVLKRALETFVPAFPGPLTLVFLCSGLEVSETMFCKGLKHEIAKVVFVDSCNGPIMKLDEPLDRDITKEDFYYMRPLMKLTDEPYVVQCEKDLPGVERLGSFEELIPKLPGYKNCVVLGFCSLTHSAYDDPFFPKLCDAAESCANVAPRFRHWRTFRGPVVPNPWETADGAGAVADLTWAELREVGVLAGRRSKTKLS